MHTKVIEAINFLKTCTDGMLKEKLRGNPDNWDICFGESSREYREIVLALKSNSNATWSRNNPIYCPTAVKLVNKF